MAKSQSLVMAGINCVDSVQILLCCAMTCVCYGLLCFRLLSARFLIGYCFISRDNLQIRRAFNLGVPPTHQDLWSYIQHVECLRFTIGASPTFFWADSVTLNTLYTTEQSEKIIFRSTKIIVTLPRIAGRGEICPKSTPDYLVCTQHKKTCA